VSSSSIPSRLNVGDLLVLIFLLVSLFYASKASSMALATKTASDPISNISHMGFGLRGRAIGFMTYKQDSRSDALYKKPLLCHLHKNPDMNRGRF